MEVIGLLLVKDFVYLFMYLANIPLIVGNWVRQGIDIYQKRFRTDVKKKIYFKSDLQIVPFEIIPLEANVLSHPSLPCLHAFLEELFNSEILCSSVITGLCLPYLQNRVPWVLEEEKNHMEPGQVSREAALAWWWSSQPGNVRCSGHCEQPRCRVQQPHVIMPQLLPLLAH